MGPQQKTPAPDPGHALPDQQVLCRFTHFWKKRREKGIHLPKVDQALGWGPSLLQDYNQYSVKPNLKETDFRLLLTKHTKISNIQ